MPGSNRRWIKVFATEPIAPGDELFADYGGVLQRATSPSPPAQQHMNLRPQHTDAAQYVAEHGSAYPQVSPGIMEAINSQLPDGVIYTGPAAFEQVLSCDFFYSSSNEDTFITTAALRRSGNQPPDKQSPPSRHADISHQPLPASQLAAAAGDVRST